jgi:hypothetical protein
VTTHLSKPEVDEYSQQEASCGIIRYLSTNMPFWLTGRLDEVDCDLCLNDLEQFKNYYAGDEKPVVYTVYRTETITTVHKWKKHVAVGEEVWSDVIQAAAKDDVDRVGDPEKAGFSYDPEVKHEVKVTYFAVCDSRPGMSRW